jgi:hypothetical protein
VRHACTRLCITPVRVAESARINPRDGRRAPVSMAVADVVPAHRFLSDLPEELQGRVLSFLGVADLCRASAATLPWREMAQECAEQRACAIVSATYRGRSTQPGATGPCWLRILETCEVLEEAVGRPPARSWKEEWVPLQLQHLRLRAVAAGPEAEARLKAILTPDVLAEITRDWQPGGAADVESLLRDASSLSVGWKEAQGWPRTHAEAYTLLASTFKAVLGHAVRSHSSVSLVRVAIRGSPNRNPNPNLPSTLTRSRCGAAPLPSPRARTCSAAC